MTTRPTRRGGFTLIEMLVVIAIVAALAALAAGTFFRIQSGEYTRATESALSKINSGLDRRWSAIRDQAAKDSQSSQIPAAVFSFAGNDKDRAQAVWTALRLRNEFPTTVPEALGDVCPNSTQAMTDTRRGIWVWWPAVTSNPAILVLQPRAIFSKLPNVGTQEQQSAACLYQALTASGVGGEVMTGEGTGQQTADVAVGGSSSLRVFTDGWGTPIAFCRMAYTTEVNNTPWTKVATNKDFCDPTGKLLTQTATWTSANLTQYWTMVTQNHLQYNGLPTSYPSPAQNWVSTAISAGPNRSFYSIDKTKTPPVPSYAILGNLTSSDDGYDNLLSFRLRKEGNRGE